MVLTPMAFAADPESGSISPDAREVSFVTGPSLVSNPSGDCSLPTSTCDEFALSVTVPSDYLTAHPNAQIRVSTAWANVADDYDVYMYLGDSEVGASAGSANPEAFAIVAAAGDYVVQVSPFLVTGGSATTTVTLVDDDGETGGTEPPPPASGLAPRFKLHVSPADLGNDSGEPTIGYNPLSKHAMFISYVQALRLTFQENLDPAMPASCDAIWEDKSGTITTLNSLDPIIYTDQVTGRTFNSQLSGANSLFEYSDDDGETWTPGQVGPPNGGADHQGVVSGPYPEGFLPTAGLLYPNAVYYCSQSIAAAFCARSDDGGQTFGPGAPFKNTDCTAGALHGHPKVAPDGTLYVPDSSQCLLAAGESAEKVVAFVSEDAGTTFVARPIPQSAGGAGSDPSIGIATDGTVYECYENADSHIHMAVSHDKGETWVNDVDLTAYLGLVDGEFPAAAAGDPDRAACAFIGTTTPGNSESLDFEGVWYPYIATTYDGGQTYHVVNVSPDDPVQGFGGVGPSGTNRNLLDFNDMELDEQGRIYFAYADGCIGICVSDPSKNTFAAKGTVARQSGGRTLYAAYDSVEPMQPNNACLSGIRTETKADLGWKAPDNGGSAVTEYKVYRSQSPDSGFALLGSAGPKTDYTDTTVDPAVEKYYYRVTASNALGAGPDSNTIELPIVELPVPESSCTLPGITIAQDAVGDSPVPSLDVVAVNVAELPDLADKLVITLTIDDLSPAVPPESYYFVLLKKTDGSDFFVSMDTQEGTPAFHYGTYQEDPAGQGLLIFTNEGDLDENSAVSVDNNTITLVVDKTLFGDEGLKPGDIVVPFDVRTRVGASAVPSRDTAGGVDYTVRGTDICLANLAPLAILSAPSTATTGKAIVLQVSGTDQDAGDSVVSYTLSFGDGEVLEDQAFDATGSQMLQHTYAQAGNYAARLTVKDSRGAVSSNVAEQIIEVADESGGGGGGGGGGSGGTNRSGGALGAGLLLPFAVMALMRRRRRG
jgi:hypothetical protein